MKDVETSTNCWEFKYHKDDATANSIIGYRFARPLYNLSSQSYLDMNQVDWLHTMLTLNELQNVYDRAYLVVKKRSIKREQSKKRGQEDTTWSSCLASNNVAVPIHLA